MEGQLMADLIDSQMPHELQDYAKKILREFDLDNMKVRFDSKQNSLVFELDRRVVNVPIKLLKEDSWTDIRLLFRSVLGSANSLWNYSADNNDWS
jgi:hypothetical protein